MSRRRTLRRWTARAVGAGAKALATYLLVVRPWHRSWGATREEARGPLPGDDLVPGARFTATRAVSIAARPDEIWPWLVQMGVGRGGFYAYDAFLRRAGFEVDSADRILDPGARLAPGDVVPVTAEGGMPVLEVETERHLVLCPSTGNDATWALVLRPVGPRRTRLVSRLRWRPPRTVEGLMWFGILDPGSFVMQRAFLLGVRRRAEALSERRRLDEAWSPARRPPPWSEVAAPKQTAPRAERER